MGVEKLGYLSMYPFDYTWLNLNQQPISLTE